MTAAEIVEAYGGTRALSQITGASRNAVAMWRRDGVPSKFWPLLARTPTPKGNKRVTLAILEAHRNGKAS